MSGLGSGLESEVGVRVRVGVGVGVRVRVRVGVGPAQVPPKFWDQSCRRLLEGLHQWSSLWLKPDGFD